MERISIPPRVNWKEAVEALGFGYHSAGTVYWDESALYAFDMDEISALEKATASLWEICLFAVQYVIDNHLFEMFRIPPQYAAYIQKTWDQDLPSIYGRFDLCYKEGKIKMLEFNADTPTSLFEAAVVQWYWLQEYTPAKDQFNSLHEKLVGYWAILLPYLKPGSLYFSCVKESLEDFTNTEYLQDCAMQAGLSTKFIFIEDIGWDEEAQLFVDWDGLPITNIFKLYPWEFLLQDKFGANICRDEKQPLFIEPAWKMILSNKAILPLLWQLFPNHPHLLPAFFEPPEMSSFVKKPILSREGANIEIRSDMEVIAQTGGEYGDEGYIYQEFFSLPCFGGNYPVIGSWIIGQEPAGIGIRESNNLITDNLSRFVPHLIV